MGFITQIRNLISCSAFIVGGALFFPMNCSVAEELRPLAPNDEIGAAIVDPIVVYTTARNILFDEPARAILLLESMRSAVGSQGISQLEWDLFYAYAIYHASGEKSPDAKRLRKALYAYDNAALPISYELGRILTDYSKRQLAEGSIKRARKTAVRAEQILLTVQPEDVSVRSQAVIWGGVAMLLKEPQFNTSIRAAYKEFGRARALFPIDQDATDFDPAILEAVAWQAAAAGAMATRAKFTRDLDSLDAPFSMPLAGIGGTSSVCAIAWETKTASIVRKKVAWAPNLISNSVPSGFVVAIDLSADGAPTNIRLLAEALPPEVVERTHRELQTRDKALSKALGRWHAQIPPTIDESCMLDLLLVFGGYAPSSDGDQFRGIRRSIQDG